ncbi:hypothetical protein [Celeribacter sp.]|uniref:hypothetical protein n=1 Tax=Celeribacter sp. TaxID=1890673 RepID=UPI003A8F32AE
MSFYPKAAAWSFALRGGFMFAAGFVDLALWVVSVAICCSGVYGNSWNDLSSLSGNAWYLREIAGLSPKTNHFPVDNSVESSYLGVGLEVFSGGVAGKSDALGDTICGADCSYFVKLW